MNYIKTLANTALAVALCCSFQSCTGDDEQELKVEQNITSAFAHVYEISQGLSANYTGLSYNIVYDYIAATASVTINGLKLPGSEQYPSIKLTDVPFSVNQAGYRVLDGKDLKVQMEGFGTVPQFNNFNLICLDRMIGQNYYPALCMTYTIDSRYKVVSSVSDQVIQGTTVTTPEDGEAFTSTDPVYVLQFDFETQRAAITINGAQFDKNMPAQTMTFSNIPFEFDSKGKVTLEKDDTIVPTIGGTPFPAFPITELSATCQLGEKMNLAFVCTIRGAKYQVNADLRYNFTAE